MSKRLRSETDELLSVNNPDLSILEQRMSRLENLLERLLPVGVGPIPEDPIQRLEKRMEKLENQVTALVLALEKRPISQQQQTPWGCPPDHIIRHINAVVLDSDIIREKSKRAVVEKLPEGIDERDVVKSIAEKYGVADDLILDEIHRHPKERSESTSQNPRKPRILKIPFASTESRDIFLKKFRMALSNLPNFPKFLSARRDMTQSELSILYNFRSQAYNSNSNCGLFKYYVSDLTIREFANPKPFRTHTNNH
ncbi:hypothetical protein niasHT_033901 [Heterodera trifolii]|uniref:Uncharacterized protein n=1 Tax=Heterodera trifolii TaxID=157864 RepID=A0ABD2HVQ4_9BILA